MSPVILTQLQIKDLGNCLCLCFVWPLISVLPFLMIYASPLFPFDTFFFEVQLLSPYSSRVVLI